MQGDPMSTTERSATEELALLEPYRQSMPTARCDMSYIDAGPSAGVPAVFVHGVGTNAFLWRHVITGVMPVKRAVALDLPLHGGSGAPRDGDVTLDTLADSVTEFIRGLEVGPVDLVAHDTGGGLAQIVAGRDPALVRSLVLTNCETHDNVPPPAFLPTVELARQGALAPTAPALLADLAAARAAVFTMGYEDPDQPDLAIVDAYLRPILASPERARQFEQLLASMDPAPLLAVEPALRRFTAPTLVVWATNDEFFELRWAQWLRDTIPGVTDVVEIEGAKLFFPDERGAELVPHLLAHWERVEARSAA
jgi:pimeloyl-ACP methyl ester carboxylesterase